MHISPAPLGIALATLIGLSLAAPTPPSCASHPAATLPSAYTLTAYRPGDARFNGLKVNNLNLFQEKVGQYCPSSVGSSCPNGTDQVFVGTLTPSVLVPGGQDLYVTSAGRISITVQHSHSIPPDAYWSYQGWTWHALSDSKPATVRGCPRRDPLYNCTAPSGYFTFRAPGDTSVRSAGKEGGVLACPYEQQPGGPETKQYALWARTPGFVEGPGCVELVGLGTQAYGGVMPPVWAY